MTRGNIVIIDKDGRILASIQFNGDMYPSGHGNKAIEALKTAADYSSYRKNVYAFDKNIFGYQFEGYYPDLIEKWDDLDFSNDYFARFNSDYIYIKNLSDRSYEIIQKDGTETSIAPGEIQVYDFGIRDESEEVTESINADAGVAFSNKMEELQREMEQTCQKMNDLQQEYKKLLEGLKEAVSESKR